MSTTGPSSSTIWSLNASAVKHCIVPKSVKPLCSSATSTGLLLDVGYRPQKIYNTGMGGVGRYKYHFPSIRSTIISQSKRDNERELPHFHIILSESSSFIGVLRR